MKYLLLLLITATSLCLLSTCDTGGDPLGDALLEAAAQGKIDQMKVCIDNGVDINYSNPKFFSTQQTACCKAAAHGQLEALKWLVEQGADWHKGTNTQGRNPITFAAAGNHFDIVYYLLEVGEDVNYQENGNGMNALLYASELGNLQAVKTLLEKGANMQVRTTSGQTPISVAAARCQPQVFNFWIQKGLKAENRFLFDMAKSKGGSSLQASCQQVLDAILQAGIDINAQDEAGNTALHLAYEQEHEAFAQELKSRGIDEQIKNNKGLTAMEIKEEVLRKKEAPNN